MKIYFTAAISAKDQFGDNYEAIVRVLENMGHTVVADHILQADMGKIKGESQAELEQYYKEMQRHLRQSDLLVAEVSFPSTVHVGHELTLALEKDKPILALHVKGKKPVLFWGITSDKFYVAEYDLNSLKRVLKDSIEFLADQVDTRFNFFISPKHGNYLDWVAKNRKVPRAVYLRRLIEKDMEKNKDYEG